MNDVQYLEQFIVGDRSYDVLIMKSGEVIFARTVESIDSWGHTISSTSLENDSNGKAIAIFRSVTTVLSEMVYKYRPPLLWFRIINPKRKRLYTRLVRNFLDEHSAYTSCDDDWEERLYVVRAN